MLKMDFFSKLQQASQKFWSSMESSKGQSSSLSDFADAANEAARAVGLPVVDRKQCGNREWEQSCAGVLAELYLVEQQIKSPMLISIYTSARLEKLWTHLDKD